MYICVKFSSRDLNSAPYLSHLTSIYACRIPSRYEIDQYGRYITGTAGI